MRIKVISFWPFRDRSVAVTLPPWGILLRKSWYDEAPQHRRHKVLRHEMAHWRQYEMLGLLRFYVEYAWGTIRYGYEKHPMEIEARRVANL